MNHNLAAFLVAVAVVGLVVILAALATYGAP